MKNNYSIVQRNALVEDHLWCINSFMEKNRKLVKATGMEHDDVFQQLALRLIKAVAGYDPDKGALQPHLRSVLIRTAQLQVGISSVRYHRRSEGVPQGQYHLFGLHYGRQRDV